MAVRLAIRDFTTTGFLAIGLALDFSGALAGFLFVLGSSERATCALTGAVSTAARSAAPEMQSKQVFKKFSGPAMYPSAAVLLALSVYKY